MPKRNSETTDPVALMERSELHSAEDNAAAIAEYQRLIIKAKLPQAEAVSLAEFAQELGKTSSEVKADRDAYARAVELSAEVATLPGKKQRLVDAREAYAAFLERIDLENTALEERKATASRRVDLCRNAEANLKKLAGQFPHLFESVEPPRLRTK